MRLVCVCVLGALSRSPVGVGGRGGCGASSAARPRPEGTLIFAARLTSDGTAIICYIARHVTPEIYLQNGQNGLARTGNSSGLRCPTDASLGSITLRNDSARTLVIVKWYPLRHPIVKRYPRRPLENYLYLPYKLRPIFEPISVIFFLKKKFKNSHTRNSKRGDHASCA